MKNTTQTKSREGAGQTNKTKQTKIRDNKWKHKHTKFKYKTKQHERGKQHGFNKQNAEHIGNIQTKQM